MKINSYVCQKCGFESLVSHKENVELPVMIGCLEGRERNSLVPCDGMAVTQFYRPADGGKAYLRRPKFEITQDDNGTIRLESLEEKWDY